MGRGARGGERKCLGAGGRGGGGDKVNCPPALNQTCTNTSVRHKQIIKNTMKGRGQRRQREEDREDKGRRTEETKGGGQRRQREMYLVYQLTPVTNWACGAPVREG